MKERNQTRMWVTRETYMLWKRWAEVKDRQLSKELDRVIKKLYRDAGTDPHKVLRKLKENA